jgi:hypothetical protein
MEICEWLLPLIGVLIAAGAAIAAWRSARAAEKAVSAQILMQIMDAYSSPEMLSGMIRLNEFKGTYKENFAGIFAKTRVSNYNEIKIVDEDRRRFSHHFSKIWRLFESGLVNEKVIKQVATRGQVDFLLEIIEPLEKAINSEYNRVHFDFFRNLYSRA